MENGLIGSRINGGNTEYRRMESDFYPTPSEVTYALVNSPAAHLFSGMTIWEPACGEGHMSMVIESCGFETVSTDIAKGSYGIGLIDFMKTRERHGDFIITNPPFSLAEEFIKHSIELGGNFALLLKSQYWHAKKRYDLFCGFPPEYIMPLTWRPDFLFKERGGGSPLMDVIWCVWGSRPAEITKFVPLLKPAADAETGA